MEPARAVKRPAQLAGETPPDENHHTTHARRVSDELRRLHVVENESTSDEAMAKGGQRRVTSRNARQRGRVKEAEFRTSRGAT